MLDELLDRQLHRAHRRRSPFDVLLGGAEPGPVLCERRGGGQHLRRGARCMRGAVTEPVGDSGGGRREPRGFGLAIAFLYVCR